MKQLYCIKLIKIDPREGSLAWVQISLVKVVEFT